MGSGESKSKNVVKTVNETITELISETSQTQEANTLATQEIQMKSEGKIIIKDTTISQNVKNKCSMLTR